MGSRTPYLASQPKDVKLWDLSIRWAWNDSFGIESWRKSGILLSVKEGSFLFEEISALDIRLDGKAFWWSADVIKAENFAHLWLTSYPHHLQYARKLRHLSFEFEARKGGGLLRRLYANCSHLEDGPSDERVFFLPYTTASSVWSSQTIQVQLCHCRGICFDRHDK